jgi:AcrR family transcriptional regulator
MPSAGKQLRLRNRPATEEALIAAATAVFAEQGFEKATTRGIAEAAHCSEGLIQRYFKGKKGLLLAVLNQHNEEADRDFFKRPLCSTLTDEARETFAHFTAHFGGRSEQMRVVLSRVLLDHSFRADLDRISARKQVRKGIKGRLALYADAGLLFPRLDLRSATELLMTLAFELGFMHRELHRTHPADIRRLADDFAAFFGRAVTAPGIKRRAKR